MLNTIQFGSRSTTQLKCPKKSINKSYITFFVHFSDTIEDFANVINYFLIMKEFIFIFPSAWSLVKNTTKTQARNNTCTGTSYDHLGFIKKDGLTVSKVIVAQK